MLNFRCWIILSVLLVSVWSLDELKTPEELRSYTEAHDSHLIGYIDEALGCTYTGYFRRQMQIVADKLSSLKIGVALTRGSYKNGDVSYGNPIAVFQQKNRDPVPITWMHKGNDIANWIIFRQNMSSPLIHLTSRDQYDYYLKARRTVFLAYFDDDNDVEKYGKAVENFFEYPFLIIRDASLAMSILNLEDPGIVVDHNWAETKRVLFDRLKSWWVAYNKEILRGWIREQIQEQTTELTYNLANKAFATIAPNIAIMFVPKSLSNYTEATKNFSNINLHLKNKKGKEQYATFYSNSENSRNKPLLEFFEIPYGATAIVLLEGQNKLDAVPFTSRCNPEKVQRRDITKVFQPPAMFDNYKNNLGI